MSKVQLAGNANGTGIFTIASPNSNTDRTLTLPDNTGTLLTSGGPISGTTGTFTSLLNISASGAGQIQFPATQNASSNANTLDDYEEGTFTPFLTNGGTVSIVQTPRYTKVGRIVTVSGYIDWSGVPNNSSHFQIDGLPFSPSGTYAAGSYGWVGGANVNGYILIAQEGLAYMYFHLNNGNSARVTNSQVVGAGFSTFIFTMTYTTT